MPLVLAHGSTRLPLVDRVSVGSGKSCDLSIVGMAEVHLLIEATSDRLLVKPALGAPVSVGGVSIEPEACRWIHFGDKIVCGVEHLFVDLEETELPLRTAELALAIVRRLKTSRAPILHVVEGPDLGAELELADEGRVHRVGRGPTCSLRSTDPTVSREHVRIARKGQKVYVADMDAPRGTFLGSTRLVPGDDAEWDPALAIRIGRTVLRLQLPDGSERIEEVARALVPEAARAASEPSPLLELPSEIAPPPAATSPIAQTPPLVTPLTPTTEPARWPYPVAIAGLVLIAAGLIYWIVR